ncbi:FAD-binding oxidoreductase [Candidatus Saccharibacteria bacterium]|nr:FAD-binding oxidoreductase [Candidatus Saccharibacteria bacterium]
MNKLAYYLQEHLNGEVTSAIDVRRHFAHDASIMQIMPAVVVYPRGESDVRKAVRFAWQLAERGKKLPVTARGMGSSTSGAAIGSGAVLVFPAHMNELLALNTKKRFISIEPGANYGTIEQTLNTHGLSLPAYPPSKNYTTLGGAIANNALGEKSVKYGATGNFVQSLRVVLSNGEVIETGPLNKKELNHKLGLQSLEGVIYRSLDTMLEENADFITRCHNSIKTRHNAAGYNIRNVKKNGEFDITPLFVGSQGTLGIITEATLDVVKHSPKTTIALISVDDLGDLYDLLSEILRLKPSILDMLNRTTVEQVKELNPNQLAGSLSREKAAMHLFVQFDEPKDGDRQKAVKQLTKIVGSAGAWLEVFETPDSQERVRKIRDSVGSILIEPRGQARAVPVAEDVSVPVDRLIEFLTEVDSVYNEVGLAPAAWGQAGSGVVRMWPPLDLGKTGDRQKLFKIQNHLYAAAVRLGGSISAAAGDGRVRAPYLALQYGEELSSLMLKVKKIFDPHGILNPGVKTASTEEVKALLRTEYSLSNFYDYLPRS